MIDVTLTFNGYDFSDLLSTYRVTYEVEVADSVRTIDGTEHVASFMRPVIEFSLIPLSEDQTDDVYNALSAINANATYTDPHRGAVESSEPFRVASNLNAVFALKAYNGKLYYKGGTITLRRKTVL